MESESHSSGEEESDVEMPQVPETEEEPELLPKVNSSNLKRPAQTGLFNQEYKRRRLQRELKNIRIRHPNIDMTALTKLDDELNSLPDEDLELQMENARAAVGGATPFATGTVICSLIGYAIERFGEMPGFKNQLTQSTEALASTECACPISFSDYGPVVQAVSSIGTEITKYWSKPWTAAAAEQTKI